MTAEVPDLHPKCPVHNKRHPGERRGPVHFAFRINVETQWAFAINGNDLSSLPLAARLQRSAGASPGSAQRPATGPAAAQQPAQELTFPIEGFLVEGNTLLPPEVVQDTLEGHDRSRQKGVRR